MDYVEEFDKLKTKVLKYILFKKRTEQEVKAVTKDEKEEKPEEKSLYDLIDMMYDEK